MKAKAVLVLLAQNKGGPDAVLAQLERIYEDRARELILARFGSNRKPAGLLALRRECDDWLTAIGALASAGSSPLPPMERTRFHRLFDGACGLQLERASADTREQRPATAAGRAGAPREEQHQHLTMSQLARVSARPANGRPNPAAKRRNVPRMR